MTGRWATSTRRDRLPADWPKRRARILKRDGFRCTEELADGKRCPAAANEVDHLVAGDDHSDLNLASKCKPHHAAKSAREGAAAAAVARSKRPGRRRPREPHPGLIRPT